MTAGHSSAQPGLQRHSLGETYPWVPVAYIHDGRAVYRAENLLTGATSALYRLSCAKAQQDALVCMILDGMSIKDRWFYAQAVTAALAAPRGWREDRILATLRIVREDTHYPGCAVLTGQDNLTAIVHLERKEFIG